MDMVCSEKLCKVKKKGLFKLSWLKRSDHRLIINRSYVYPLTIV
jgi:hypothetical protein